MQTLKGIRLDDEIIKEIEKLAIKENRSWSNMVKQLINEALRARKIKQ